MVPREHLDVILILSQTDPRPSLRCVKRMEATLVVAGACEQLNLSRKDADFKTIIPSWAPDVAQFFTSDSWPHIAATLPSLRWFSWLASMFPKAHQLFVPSAMMTLCLLEFLVSLRVRPDGDVWHNVWTAEHVQSIKFTSDKFRLVCICYALEGIVNMCQGGLRRNRSETDLVWCHSISTEAVSFQIFAFRWGKDANFAKQLSLAEHLM